MGYFFKRVHKEGVGEKERACTELAEHFDSSSAFVKAKVCQERNLVEKWEKNRKQKVVRQQKKSNGR